MEYYIKLHPTTKNISKINKNRIRDYKDQYNDIVGLTLRSYGYGKFKVLNYDGKNSSGKKTYTIQFINSECIIHNVSIDLIQNGMIKDQYSMIKQSSGINLSDLAI